MYNVDIPLAPTHIHILHQYYTDGPLCNLCGLKKSRWSSVFAQLFAMQKRISGSRWLCLGTCFLRTGFHSCLRPTRKDLKGEQPNSQSFSSTKAIHVINWPGQAGFALHRFAFIQWHVIVIKSIESRLGKLLCFGSRENIHTDHHWSVCENRIRCTSSCTLAHPHFTYRIPLPKILKYSQITMPPGARANGW